MKDKVTLVKGVEGIAVYINGYRVCGPKPWGGGPVLKEWEVDRVNFDTALKVRAVVHAGADGCSPVPDTVDPNHEAARPPVGLERGSNAADQTWVARSGEDNPPPPHGSTDLNLSEQEGK